MDFNNNNFNQHNTTPQPTPPIQPSQPEQPTNVGQPTSVKPKGMSSQKKKILLATLIPIGAIAVTTAIVVPTVLACKSKSTDIVVEITTDSSQGVTVKDKNIVKGQDSTITLDIPQGKEVETLVITVGGKTLQPGDYSIDANNKITIKGEFVDGGKISIKVTVSDKLVINSISIKTPATSTYFKVGDTFTSSGLVITAHCDTGDKDISSGFTTDYDNVAFQTAHVAPNKDVTVTFKGKTCTYKINVNTKETSNFTDTSWTALADIINKFENTTQNEMGMRWICEEFSDCKYIETIPETITDPNRKIEAHLGNFIGKEHFVTINTKEHKTRVIGINHDRLASSTVEDPKYAAFTFEMATVLSDSEGNTLLSTYHGSNYYDYANSILRANLTGVGTGTKKWYKSDKTESSETRTAFDMLPNQELQNNIKKVVKETSKDSTHTLTTYEDKLFPITRAEIATTTETQSTTEGFSYQHWIGKTQADRIKTDVNGTTVIYALNSGYTSRQDTLVGVAADGSFTPEYDQASAFVYYALSVSFAFCI